MTEVDPTKPPPFHPGPSMAHRAPLVVEINQQTNGQLSPVQMDALTFTFADHLRVKGELEDAQRDIGELRQQRKEDAVEIEGLRSLRNYWESMAHAANAERDLAMDQRAEYAVKLDMLRKILNDTGTGGKPE